MKQRFGILAVTCATLITPVAIATGSAAEYFLKRANPDHVDITLGLAYLKPILSIGIGFAVALVILSILLAVVGLKKDESSGLAKLALVLVLIVSLLSVAGGVLKNQSDKLEDAQAKTQVSDFFKKLSR